MGLYIWDVGCGLGINCLSIDTCWEGTNATYYFTIINAFSLAVCHGIAYIYFHLLNNYIFYNVINIVNLVVTLSMSTCETEDDDLAIKMPSCW